MEDEFFDHDDHNNHVLNDDDIMFEDYILHEEYEKEQSGKQNRRNLGGCLGMMIVFLIPTVILSLYLSR